MNRRTRCALAGAVFLALAARAPAVAQLTPEELAGLSLEELVDLEVTSVTKQGQALSSAPASIYVVTADDIRRAGVTTLPEALRLAPNLQVARVDSTQYAISARGFNNAVGNKLLVLVDGRTVYKPLFSSVFWDAEDLMLEDVERIEVISGPGATLWGANAVNGVINVILRPAADTQGTLVAVNGGNLEQGAAARHGGRFGASGHYRVYAKGAHFDSLESSTGAELRNSWDRGQAGFRADWDLRGGDFTLAADAYQGRSEHRGGVGSIELPPVVVSGGNLLARWERSGEDGSSTHVQAYVDRSEREEVVLFQPRATIVDLELHRRFSRGAHRLMVGGGYRHSRDRVPPGLLVRFIPERRELDWANLFVQDELALGERLTLTAGLKLEHNDYTGVEHLPSVRLAWQRSAASLVWGALSRAVRAPARLDRDVFVPVEPPFLVRGGPNFRSEVANVAELGYRGSWANAASLSVTGFYSDWDHLRSGQTVPQVLENRLEGETYGGEAWGTWQPLRFLRLSAGAMVLRKDLRLEPGSTDPLGANNPTLANDPDFQWRLRSAFDLGGGQELDLTLRQVDELPNPRVPAYTTLDVRYGVRLRRGIELWLAGTDLLDSSHAEFGDPGARGELPRGWQIGLRWRR